MYICTGLFKAMGQDSVYNMKVTAGEDITHTNPQGIASFLKRIIKENIYLRRTYNNITSTFASIKP